MFPKVHKPENPGRPVTSYVNCHTTSISQHNVHYLQSHVQELKSCVKDPTDFIKIKKNTTFETTLKRKNKPTMVIITFLKLILTLNNFIFNCKTYLQIKGCAMGTKCAPTYANIFMGMFEKKLHLPFNSRKM